MKYLQFDGEGFNPSDKMAFKGAFDILSPEGKKAFEKLLDEMDHESFEEFKNDLYKD